MIEMINKFMKNIIILFLITISSACIASEQKMPSPVGAVTIIGDIPAPFGWRDFCRKYPQECREQKSNPTKIELTASLWKNLQEVKFSILLSGAKSAFDINAVC
jgi:predicted transglutaminase-like cysteine proteinase